MEVLPGPSDASVRELANQILSNPPFAAWNEVQSEALRRFLAWVSNCIAWMNAIYLASPLLYWLILGGLLLLVLGLLGHITWSIRVALKVPTPQARARIEARPMWSKEASDLAAQGRYLEAAHRLALGCVQRLVSDGHIELKQFEANPVLRKRVRTAALPAELSTEFLRLLDSFETRWFRDRLEDPDLYEAWSHLHARIAALPAQLR